MSIPRMAFAASRASAGDFATLIPPAFPRPPTCTCALTATGAPIALAADSASAGVVASRPSGIGMPARARTCFAWYSCSFTGRLGGYRRAMRRVSVVGGSGSGKTTTGRAIADRLGVPFVETDALHWTHPGLVLSLPVELRVRVEEAARG